jgi:hypothetical protein
MGNGAGAVGLMRLYFLRYLCYTAKGAHKMPTVGWYFGEVNPLITFVALIPRAEIKATNVGWYYIHPT